MQQRTNHFSTFVQPTEVTYAHLMKASLVAGKHSRVLELWRQLLASGVDPGARSTRVVLTACAKGGDVVTALKARDFFKRHARTLKPLRPPSLHMLYQKSNK